MDNQNHDLEYLQRCRSLIEQKLAWRPASEWRNYEFEQLSTKILDVTGINLSTTTLKRLFGKLKYESVPSTVTLNALANYVGFSSWMEFKSTSQISLEPLTINKPERRVKRGAWLAGTIAVIVCAISAFLFASGKSSNVIRNESAIVFNSEPIAQGLPNSVVFHVDLKGNNPDNIIIQQSWDTSRTVRLLPSQTEATGIYYFPGYFRAKLILDNRIVKEHDLFIKSGGWMATLDYKPIPTYIQPRDLVFENEMDVSTTVMTEIKKITEPTFLTYHLVQPFDHLASDNFSLEASIKNSFAEGSAVCKTVKIFILCSKGAFIIPFTIPGCISDVNFKANDCYIDGKSNDLSSFGIDLTEWTDVKVETKARKIKIYAGGRIIREASYSEDAGEVVGLRFSFLGAGAVKYVRLKDKDGKVNYSNDFNFHQ